MNHGFVRVGAAAPKLKVAECEYNAGNIIGLILKAESQDLQFVVFPELALTAYTCADLFHQQKLLEEAEKQLLYIMEKTENTGVVSIIGIPVYMDNQLFNCAAVIQRGKLLGVVPKSYIPNYSEFYEERWFSPGSKAISSSIRLCGQEAPFGVDLLFEAENQRSVCFGIEICEDLWVTIPPSSYQAVSGATLLFNLSASNEIIGKQEYRRELVKQQSGRCVAAYVYASSGVYESTTDLVFGGHCIIGENGGILTESQRFQYDNQLIFTETDIDRLVNDRIKNSSFMEVTAAKPFRKVSFELKQVSLGKLTRHITANPFVPSDAGSRDERCSEIFAIQTAGLGKRMLHTGLKHAVIAISGGLDSTLALLVTTKTFDLLGMPRSNIIAVTMPGFGTTNETYTNAINLMKSLNVTIREISIRDACLQHFKDIGHEVDDHDITYENVQARERTQIIMDIANKIGGLAIGTGDLSELALGWCTYNGDHMSMYSVNSSIPKTLIRFLVQWVADNIIDTAASEVLNKIIKTPITPELLPPDPNGKINQKTEDIIGPYELHDFFLYHMLRYGAPPRKILFLAEQAFKGIYDINVVKHWLKVFLRRFFSQQFKRSCMPDGPKVGTISLSPRGDWRMPSDADAGIWLKELENEA